MGELRLAFGPFVLNPEAGTLTRQGLPLSINYRGLRLLAELASREGEVLTKGALLDVGWPGAIVEESNLTVQIAALRKLLGPMAEGGDWIATVQRVGYRFAGTLQRTQPGAAAADPAEPGPSIAVLPFANLSDDAEQRHFADGLAEDIITRLARLRWLFVCSRNSSFSYRDKEVDVRQVGRDLGVRYVLGGSVRRSGQRLRITAELSDALSGRQVWGNTFDVELVDFFAVQDQIAGSVIGAIEPKLYAAEHLRFQGRSRNNLDAWGFVMQAMPHIWTWSSGREIADAEALLRSAVEVDPNYPRANSLLACSIAAQALLGLSNPDQVLQVARDMAQRAIHRDPEDAWSHFAVGYVHMISRRFDEAVAALTEATSLNPSLAIAHIILGSTYAYGGMADDGLHHLGLAAQLSPRDFAQAANHSVRGLCFFMQRRFAEAAEMEKKAVALMPVFGTAWRTLAASAGLAGDLPTARQALIESRRLQPSLSVEWVERHHAIVHEKDRTLYIEGLRLAGLE
jgi:TolB-like protein/Flp pilus assembly protein TadD